MSKHDDMRKTLKEEKEMLIEYQPHSKIELIAALTYAIELMDRVDSEKFEELIYEHQGDSLYTQDLRVQDIAKALHTYLTGKDEIIDCPSCERKWDIVQHSVCECGTQLKNLTGEQR